MRPVELSTSDTLRISLRVRDDAQEGSVQPEQAIIRWEKARGELERAREWMAPLKVRATGKARFEVVSSFA